MHHQNQNTILQYFSSSPRPQLVQINVRRKENIYETALKRKLLNDLEVAPPPSKVPDERDEIIKQQKLEIEELRVNTTKYKKTQNEMIKMIHHYHGRILRLEKTRPQSKPSPVLSYTFDVEITEEEKREHFSESEIIQLNSFSARKSSDRAYCRKLFEFLYRNSLSSIYTRTLSSNSKTGKVPITPHKLEIMKKMMLVRGKKCKDEIEKLERTTHTYISGILSDALCSVKRMHAPI